MKRYLLLLAACASQDIVASGAGTGPAYCQGSGPPILTGDVCTGDVAVQTFGRALCTCEGYATSTMLTTDSFDSVAGPYVPDQGTSGDVGIDGPMQTSAMSSIHGSLALTGNASLMADLSVSHALDVGGTLGGKTVVVGSDAHVAGDIAVDQLTVAGQLTVPASATITGAVSAGATLRAPVSVAPPCACDAQALVDIPAFVAAHASDNQNAAIGLASDQLTDYTGDQVLDLPCGIYYLGPVHGNGALTLRITGRVALLVDGDLALTAPFNVVLATDGAELDLMVSGLLSSNHAIVAGRTDHPSRTRIYVGGDGDIDLSGDSQLAVNFYAPKARLALSGNATIFGALFVRRLDQAAPVEIHYDVDVRRADVGCLR